jgi:hypothetical protein
MIVSNDESKKPITCNIETQYKASQYKANFVGCTVEGKTQISSYLDKISDKTDIIHQKTIKIDNLGIKIDIAFDKSTSESYYDVSLNVTHSNIDEEADQHIENSDFNKLITYYLADLSNDTLLKDESVINSYVTRAAEMSCSCNNFLLVRASYVANAITMDTLNNNVRSITEKYKTK